MCACAERRHHQHKAWALEARASPSQGTETQPRVPLNSPEIQVKSFHGAHPPRFHCALFVCAALAGSNDTGRLQYLRIGLHHLSVSADKMSPLGTESTQCCSRHTDVKYCLEVILHIGFGVVGISNGRLATADAFADLRNVLRVSSILVRY